MSRLYHSHRSWLDGIAVRRREKALDRTIAQLSRIYCMHPASYPLFSLLRAKLDLLLYPSLDYERQYHTVFGLARRILAAIEAVLAEGNPVRAVQSLVVARLHCIDKDVQSNSDISKLQASIELMKQARHQVGLAFGFKGCLMDDVSDSIVSLEHELLRLRSRR